MNRDRKKQKRPFEMSDFYMYPDGAMEDSIDGIYGAAAIAMVESKVFPSWALFAYKQIVKNAEKSTAPDELYYMSNNAVIIAPKIVESCVKGLLIAKKSAEKSSIVMVNGKGGMIKVRIPELPQGEVSLMENCYVDIISILR